MRGRDRREVRRGESQAITPDKNVAVHLKPGFERLLLARMYELKVNQRDY